MNILTDDPKVFLNGLNRKKTKFYCREVNMKDIPLRVRFKVANPVILEIAKKEGITGRLETRIKLHEEDTLYLALYKESCLKIFMFQVVDRKESKEGKIVGIWWLSHLYILIYWVCKGAFLFSLLVTENIGEVPFGDGGFLGILKIMSSKYLN